jgi:hypothetical protein
MVELDRPGLPWLFSPLQADSDGKLRPWCCLIVVEQRDGVSISVDENRPLPVLTIEQAADPAQQLPDPVNSWAWAHAQAVGDQFADRAVTRDSTKTRARLVAPRRLAPDTRYHACVVPTFEPGRLAGLGEQPYPDTGNNNDNDGRSGPVSMAWDLDDLPEIVKLPVYHEWEFKTGQRGDFESLVRKLEPETLDSIGYRDVDASQPGVEALATVRRPVDVRMEGALRSAGLDDLAYPDEQRETLRELLDGDLTVDADTRPTFGPPMYGRYHADRETVPDSDNGQTWFRQLNLDPANRVAAGLGVAVVRENQEELMAAAWDQVGEVREANRLLRRAQLSRAASNRVHEKLAGLSDGAVLSFSAAMHGRATWTGRGETFAKAIRETRVPSEALSPTLRRLLRRGGALDARLEGQLPTQSALLRTLNQTGFSIERPEAPDGTVTFTRDEAADICRALEDLPDLNDPTGPSFVERYDQAEPEGLIDTLWNDCEAARQALDELSGSGDDDGAQQLTEELRRGLQRVCRERGGEFDDESNLLAGLTAAVQGGDDQETVGYLARVAQATERVCDAARQLGQLADTSMVGVDPATVNSFLEVCRRFRETLAVLAAMLLPSACALLRERVPSRSDLPMDGPVGDRLDEVLLVAEAACGTDGLVDDLLAGLVPGGTGNTEETLRGLRRWIGVARDHLSVSEVRDALGDAATPLSRAFRRLETLIDLVADGAATPAANPLADRLDPTICAPPEPEPSPPPTLDLSAAADAVLDALDPETAVPRRVADRIGGAGDLQSRDEPLDVVLEEPDFRRPMYKPLTALSEEHLLPGVGSIPEDSLGLLESNPAFIESYMLGANHEMARELRWREYPTDMRGTYFTQFWGAEGAVPEPSPDDRADIEDIHTWGTGSGAAPLGKNLTGGAQGSDVVLILRGELLRRYPTTTIYAAKAVPDSDGDERVPAVSTASATAPDPTSDDLKFPQYRGEIDPDITFLGFDLTAEEALHDPYHMAGRQPDDHSDEGWFVVIEEAPGEPRLGLDVNQGDIGSVPNGITTDSNGGGSNGQESGWSALSWGHMVESDGEDPLSELSYINTAEAVPGKDEWSSTASGAPEWGKNGAQMAAITWQKPVRIAIHADDMLPADAAGGESS